MGLPELVDVVRNFAVMVRVCGPDPKGLKMRQHAFHKYNSGKTTLSCSGMLLPDTLCNLDAAHRIPGVNHQGLVLVVTVASVIEPFLSPQHREATCQGRPELIPGAQVDIMLEGKLGLEKDNEGMLDEGASPWYAAQVLRLVDVPVSTLALQSLFEASSGSLDHGWEVGWSLAATENGPQQFMDVIKTQRHVEMVKPGNSSLMSKSTTRIAILGVSVRLKDAVNISISPSSRRGELLLAVGSPFGVLSPLHFFNSMSVGSIANCYPPKSPNISLLMADIRCLPGMEGSPVFSEHACLIGILVRPCRQKSTGAEIQLVIPWEAIATACSDLLLKEPQNAEKRTHINKEKINAVGNTSIHESDGPKYGCPHSNCSSPEQVEKAMASVCLITIDESVWASGVVLNDQGLILTNAHLLEPWRFERTAVNGQRNRTKSNILCVEPEESAVSGYCSNKNLKMLPGTRKILDSPVVDERTGYELNLSHKGHKRIQVRLDHVNPWIWCDAEVVHVWKGLLDVALIQLKNVPTKLCPINVDLSCPSIGSKTYVIGHALFGPRCGLTPSVCSGVLSKVVKAKVPSYHESSSEVFSHIPAMLETTAAVHPGGSGGAVVNSEGRMIGLVTSNAKHAGGTAIPHLNFSIPCAVLSPIFKFAKGMQDMSLIRNLDRPNEHLSSVWALVPPLSPKPDPPFSNLPKSLLEDDSKQVKGSKFARFIAEREKILRSSKAGSNSNENLTSKL